MIVRDTLPNFSLIIPTKDRFEILRDTLNFYCDNSYSEDIYIVDSSEEKIHQKISSFISTLPSNIKLLRYDGLGVSNAIMFALDEMDRVYEYVMQVSDDDLFIKSKKVVKAYLKMQRSQSAGIYFAHLNCYGTISRDSVSLVETNFSFTGSNVINRAKRFLFLGGNIMFGIYKFEIFRGSYSIVNFGITDNSLSSDIGVSLRHVCSGKIEYINTIGIIRSIIQRPGWTISPIFEGTFMQQIKSYLLAFDNSPTLDKDCSYETMAKIFPAFFIARKLIPFSRFDIRTYIRHFIVRVNTHYLRVVEKRKLLDQVLLSYRQ